MSEEAGANGLATTAEILAAASAAAGRSLTHVEAMGSGGDWSVVLRCYDAAGGTVVAKAYPHTAEGTSSFAAEAAGLQIVTGSGLAPDLLGADQRIQVVIMADLGGGSLGSGSLGGGSLGSGSLGGLGGGSLADALLGDSADVATSALLAWATGCGELAVAASPQRAQFDAAWTDYRHGVPDERHAAGLGQRVLTTPQHAARVGVTPPGGLDAELAMVAAAVADKRYAVFSPGDVCPDNNLLTSNGIRFLDFEEAGFQSPFLDAAYIRMPFSTCWCVFRLPADVSVAAEQAYRAQVRHVWPALGDDVTWAAGVRLAVAAWTLSSTSWLLRRSIAADVPMNQDAESPTTRQLMRYRWQALAAELDSSAELPAVAALMRALLAATTDWQAPELPLYPAFRAAR